MSACVVDVDVGVVPCALDDQSQQDNIRPWMVKAIFLLVGTGNLWFWTTNLNYMSNISRDYFEPWGTMNISDTITSAYETTCLVAIMINTWRGSLSQRLNVVCGVVHFLASLCAPLMLHYTPPGLSRVVVWHLAACVISFAAGTQQSINYAIASTGRTAGHVAWIASGQGLTGVVTFALVMLYSEAILKGRTLAGLWVQMTLNALLALVSTGGCYWMCNLPNAKKEMEQIKASIVREKKDPDRPSYWALMLEAWIPLSLVALIFFLAYLPFPNIGPLRWGVSSRDPGSHTQVNVVMGVFQVGNFVGRMLALLPPLQWKEPAISGCCLFNVCMTILIFVAAKRKTSPFWKSYGTQVILILAFGWSHGFLGTLALMRSPLAIANVKHRGRVAAMSTFALVFGIVVALWISGPIGRAM